MQLWGGGRRGGAALETDRCHCRAAPGCSGLLFQDLLREIRLETAAELCALADSEILVEGDGVDLLPSQRREQRRSLKR